MAGDDRDHGFHVVSASGKAAYNVLRHDLCAPVGAIYELGVAPTFWTDSPPAQNLTP
jgi:hypothetical protein